MTKRPSIISSFASFSEPRAEQPKDEVQPKSAHARRVPAGIIGATHRTMTDIRQERDDLAERLAKEGGPREIDPALLDPSPFPDRIVEAGDPEFARLKATIEEEGQKVPIQIRASASSPGRYQIVFGHRRWRAAAELGRPVRAEIVEATDEQLAVAQGIENSARQDLTWIERALFSWRLETSGIKAKGIRAALSVDDAELARFRSVCRALPSDIIEGIGRAPRVGRPRWGDLAAALAASPGSLARIQKTLSADKVLRATSDERFRLVLEAVRPPKASSTQGVALLRPDGRAVGRLSVSRGDVRITVDKKIAASFSSFIEAEMPELINKFFASKDADPT